ncbi:type II CRISPR RNA-guided endonuclease Cas9 [Campylobacter geochelonis]|uniref:type II CRISPR RNA-guided endonuclease Cas9 n=1 Tax=Campylobacter geochelonis TaxID=1780362 RepID=UPI000770AB32|nr:type II CRISPR RNA-guided endonuclease Cas9 [Campylobacter geochelonis]CZE46382.1 CRISPR-associated protein [Campylobacter geochelonis]
MKDYYLGLDMGSSSVGWALSDERYNLLRAKGKDLWGVRLFDEAKTAAERRTFRSQRRRLERSKWRLSLLASLFEEEISKIDDKFFDRLKDSKFFIDDKSDQQPNTLFNDVNFTDKEYHKRYPSIYHLRNALFNQNDKFDIRLIFLALSHIVKKRGHFLFDGDKAGFGEDIDVILDELKAYLQDAFHTKLEFTSEFKSIMLDKNLRKKQKEEELKNSIKISSDTINSKDGKSILIKLFLGYEANLKPFFLEYKVEKDNEYKINFSKEDYEEKLLDMTSKFGETTYFIEIAKKIHDYFLLEEIMLGFKNISASKVSIYQKHKNNLEELKKIVKNQINNSYNAIFKDIGLDNYPAYVSCWNSKKHKEKQKGCTKDKFYAFLKTKLKNINNAKEILDSIDNDDFLPRLVDKNSIIPHQIHLAELIKIIDNQSQYYPFLKEIKDKIISIFKFRIPFYVGPLNNFHKDKGGNAWIEKLKDERIFPWNFNDVVDLNKSAANFIEKMINECSYLKGEKVLAKNSLLYTKYSVLNLINKLKINGTAVSVETKQKIYNELLLKQKNIKKTAIKKFLINNSIIDKNDEISGIDDSLTSNLAVFIDFEKISNRLRYDQKEDIIKSISLFGYDNAMLKKQIITIAPDLSEDELEKLSKLRYSGFGRLSKRLLTSIKHNGKSIIEMLWDTNDNLMELLSDRYTFIEQINKHNDGFKEDINLNFQNVDTLYVSPSVKRQIWQAFKVINELISVMGREPKKIFVEMAREEGEKKRTQARKDKVLELYKSIKNNEISTFLTNFKDIKTKLEGESNLNSKKLYLYYLQLGVDIYTGEKIPFEKLFDQNIYDIDHVIPRSLKKDDSFDNLVLTSKTNNAKKTDEFPVSSEIQSKMQTFWKVLKDKDLMSEIKYTNLTRKTHLSDDELGDFIARQLVETRQSTKALTQILKNVYANSDIVYVKAGIVSEFRQQFDMLKIRELNDFHHANDAYLNIVIGNVYNIKFTKNPRNYIKEYYKKGEHYNLKIEKMLEKDIARGGNFGWDKKHSIETVQKTMKKQSPLITYRTFENKGEFFNQQPSKSSPNLLALKSSDKRLLDTVRYGGYKGIQYAHMFLVEHFNGKIIKEIMGVPIYLSKEIKDDKAKLLEYCNDVLKLKNPKILFSKIPYNSLIVYNGYPILLRGLTGVRGAAQLKLDQTSTQVVKNIVKLYDWLSQKQKELSDLSKKIEFFQENNKKDEVKAAMLEADNILFILNDRFKNTKIGKDIMNDNHLNNLYDTFINKLENSIYKNKPGGKQDVLMKEKRDLFLSFSMSKKCITLYKIIKIFGSCDQGVDFSDIAEKISKSGGIGGKNLGKNTFDLVFKENSTYTLVQSSVTGLYAKKTDLHKL